MNVTTCRTCGHQIFWAVTTNGRRMPIDAEPRAEGNVVLLGGKAHVIANADQTPEELPRYVSHFATCKDADQHRNRR